MLASQVGEIFVESNSYFCFETVWEREKIEIDALKETCLSEPKIINF